LAEPGLDLHEWESQSAQLRESAADAPRRALPELLEEQTT
jgi:hypothetical protein